MQKNNNSTINPYAKYSVENFDKFDCLKLSKSIYISLLFVLRAYIVWIISVTNMRDRVAIIQWLYPEPALFYLGLLSGLIGLYIVLILSLRRPDAANWVKRSWRNYRKILIAALIFDELISWAGFLYWQLLSLSWLIMQTVVAITIAYYCLSSDKLRLNIREFPEKTPEK